ncbi:Probable LRR receptor-like serine/threonine-protein kinase At1g67720 [Linum perenne]
MYRRIRNHFNVVETYDTGFVSLDCGGNGNYTDEIGLQWSSDDDLMFGETTNITVANETRRQYTTLRHFPADSRKYCYTLGVTSRTRYLLRATFLYGNFDNNNVYPKFDVSVGATRWSTIVISDANTIESAELIFLASTPNVSVCLSNATTGQPFISTLELRQFNGSVYYTPSENQFYLSVSARINFGADSAAPVRYPDDPFDRIWESDSLKKANFLVDVAADEMPPEKVMQTAVVGTNGSLTYRLNLDGFPGNAWAFTYLAEIEDLLPQESRKFRLVLPGDPALSKAVVNIQENAQGKYRLYEPGYPNISLPFVLSFRFGKTSDSTKGPLVNAMEINKYLEINYGSPDGGVINNVVYLNPSADWAKEGGDPCLPVPWSWVQCNSDEQPRITKVSLSDKNLTGNIPSDLTKLTGLVELWLDGNSLTGPFPDFSGCPNLEIIHLENNQLTGQLPSYLADLPNLRELHVQNNMLSGTVPSGLLNKNIELNYSGNMNLYEGGGRSKRMIAIIVSSVGAAILLLIALAVACLFMRRGKKKHHDQEPADAKLLLGKLQGTLPVQKVLSGLGDPSAEAAHYFSYLELVEATKNFERKIGSGGFGIVYYGKTKDDREIAVKLLTSNSYQGKREFANEVTLLSRIHHRNLVQFLGFCQEEGKNMLIYEYMHNGTLKEHLYGPLTHGRSINWIQRLEIAEDSAKGIEYLHTGCVPAIIHRDLKTSNILLDKHMKAKVSDFGLSKIAADGASHVSSIVRGTVGYLDPEYYISQQLTDKSDVYSFGVILLELMSGQEAISNESFGVNCRNIVQWAKLHIESGDIQRIIDPVLGDDYDIQSMWKIAEKALMCVQPHGHMRPSISEVLKEVQDAILIEKEAKATREGISEDMSRTSAQSSLVMGGYMDMGGVDNSLSLDDSMAKPTAR